MSEALLEGTIEVRQSRGDLPRQWTVLFCRLMKDGIRYYNSEKDKQPIAVIQLNQVEEVLNLEENKKNESDPPTFEIRGLDKSRIQHRCPDSKTVQMWVYQIDRVKSGQSYSSPQKLTTSSSSSKRDTAASSDDDEVEQVTSKTGTMVLHGTSEEDSGDAKPSKKKHHSKSSTHDKAEKVKLIQVDDSSGSGSHTAKPKKSKKHKDKDSKSSKSKTTDSKASKASKKATPPVDKKTPPPLRPLPPAAHDDGDDESGDEAVIDYSDLGTMQINSGSTTVEVKNTSDLFMQHVADLKMKDRLRVWDELPSVELKEQLAGKLQETYEEDYAKLLSEWGQKKAELLSKIRELEIKEAQQRFDTSKADMEKRFEELRQKMY